MITEMDVAKKAIHDKLESQIRTAEAKLDTLKARAESTKANVELKAIAELVTKRLEIQQKLQSLKNSGGDHFEKAKADLETRIADLQKSVKAIESRVHAS